MGDRCWIKVVVYRPDAQKFEDIVGVEPYDDGHPVFETDQAGDGWYHKLIQAAEAGCRFEGQHDAGGGYGSAVFVGHDGLCHDCISHNNMPVAEVMIDGVPDAEQVAAAKAYWAAFKVVRDLIDKPPVISELKEAIKQPEEVCES